MNKLFITTALSVFSAGLAEDYFQQEVQYTISVSLDDSLHTLTAHEKLIYKNNSPDTLDFIWFHLWPNAYKNDSTAFAKQAIRIESSQDFLDADEEERGFIDSLDFSVDGEKVNWDYHPDWIDVVKLDLNRPLLPGKTIAIETPFFVKLPHVFSRLGHTGQHYEITQWYPKPAVYDHKGWHPMPYLNMGEFYSEFGTFDVFITLPKKYRIMATGDLVDGEAELAWLDSLAAEGDSLHALSKKDFKKKLKLLKKAAQKDGESDTTDVELKTLHFHQENVHDFAWFADKNWIVRKGKLYLSDSTRQVTLWSFYLSKNAKMWEHSIEYLHDSGFWYSEFYGVYPYNHITAVDGDLSAGGGMEYPNITVISSMPSKDVLEMVIMHEVGHNWFYGILGSNERDHTWMDEGLNEYTNIRYWQKKYADRKEQFVLQDFIQNKLGIGKNLSFSWFNYMQYAGGAKSKDAQPLNLSADEYWGSSYGQHYAKTAVYMRYLQHYLGEAKMNEIMRDFYEVWKFRHPYPEDLETSFNKYSGENLDWFFDNVFETINYIDYAVTHSGGLYFLENLGTFTCPVEVVYYNAQGNEIFREWVKDVNGLQELDRPMGTASVKIDPDQHMPDIVRTNNATKRGVTFHFVFDRPSYDNRDISLVPWLFSYNYYNGFTPGISIYSGFIPGSGDLGIGAMVLYDLNNQKPVGGISIMKGLYLDPFHSSSVGINLSRMEGRSGLRLDFSGRIKERFVKFPIGQLKAKLNFHDLDSTALNPFLYESGKYVTGLVGYGHSWRTDSKLSYGLGGNLHCGGGFIKGTVSGSLTKKFTKKISTTVRTNLSAFLNSSDVPLQYRTYLSGGVDPDFDQAVMDRTGKSEHFKVLQNFFYSGGPGHRGLILDNDGIPVSTTSTVWSLSVDQNLPYLPGMIFADAVGGQDLSDTYMSAGLVLGPIILPLYQSWEKEHQSPNNSQWILDRLRVQFTFNLPVVVSR